MKKEWKKEALLWGGITVVFLFFVHCAFKYHPHNGFFSSVWEAGDFITFMGTIVLGFVAYSQTKSATKMAEQADSLNKEFLRIQEREYIPVLKCIKDDFCGIGKVDFVDFHVEPEPVKLCTGVFQSKKENEDPDKIKPLGKDVLF